MLFWPISIFKCLCVNVFFFAVVVAFLFDFNFVANFDLLVRILIDYINVDIAQVFEKTVVK